MKKDIRKIEEYIELVLNKGYCECNELNEIIGKHGEGSKNVAYAIDNILSDYKKVLKENLRLRYQDIPYLEGEIKGYKTRIEELKYKYDRALEDLVKSKQKIKDKIEELEKFIYTGENAPQDFLQYRIKAKIQVLQELLEGE